jgi:Ca2+-binding EF-hand superfamily protein
VFVLNLAHVYSEKSRSFAQQRELSRDLFVKLDKDCDGLIDYDEFATLMREEEGRPVWLVKAAAVAERELNPW